MNHIIAKINTHGKGVFATEDFRAGDFLFEYDGELVSREEAEIREKKYPLALGSFLYFFKFRGKNLCIDATFSKRIGRYANDEFGGKQNAAMELIVVKERPHIAVFARRNIESGEEVRYDYGVPSLPWRKHEMTLTYKAKANKDRNTEKTALKEKVEFKMNMKMKKEMEKKRTNNKILIRESKGDNDVETDYRDLVQVDNENRKQLQPEKEMDKHTGLMDYKIREQPEKGLETDCTVPVQKDNESGEQPKKGLETDCTVPVQKDNESGEQPKLGLETDCTVFFQKDNESGEQPKKGLETDCTFPVQKDNESGEQPKKGSETDCTVPVQKDNESGEQPKKGLETDFTVPVQKNNESGEQPKLGLETDCTFPVQKDNESGEQPKKGLETDCTVPVQKDNESGEQPKLGLETDCTVFFQKDNESGEQPKKGSETDCTVPVQKDNESGEQPKKGLETDFTVPVQKNNESGEQPKLGLETDCTFPVQKDNESGEQPKKGLETDCTVPVQKDNESGEQPKKGLETDCTVPVQKDNESGEQPKKGLETDFTIPVQKNNDSGEQPKLGLETDCTFPVQKDNESGEQPKKGLETDCTVPVQKDNESGEQPKKGLETDLTVPVQKNNESGEQPKLGLETDCTVLFEKDNKSGEQPKKGLETDSTVPVQKDNGSREQPKKGLETDCTVPVQKDNESGEQAKKGSETGGTVPVQKDNKTGEQPKLGLETDCTVLLQKDNESGEQPKKCLETDCTVPVQKDNESGEQPEIDIEKYPTVPVLLDNKSVKQSEKELETYNVVPIQLDIESEKQPEKGLETYNVVPIQLDNESGEQPEKGLETYNVVPIQLDNKSGKQPEKGLETYNVVPIQLDNESGKQPEKGLETYNMVPIQLDNESRKQPEKGLETYNTVPVQLNNESGKQPEKGLETYNMVPIQLDNESRKQPEKGLETYNTVPVQLNNESGKQPEKGLETYNMVPIQLHNESRKQPEKGLETYNTVTVQLNNESGKQPEKGLETYNMVPIQLDNESRKQPEKGLETYNTVPVQLNNESGKQPEKGLETYNTVPVQLDNESGEQPEKKTETYNTFDNENREQTGKQMESYNTSYNTSLVQLHHESGEQSIKELGPYPAVPVQLHSESGKQPESGLQTYYTAVPVQLDNESCKERGNWNVERKKKTVKETKQLTQQKKEMKQRELIRNMKKKKMSDKQKSENKRMRHMELDIPIGCQAFENEYEAQMEKENIGKKREKDINRVNDQRRLAKLMKDCKIVLTRIDLKVPEEIKPVCAVCKGGDNSIAEQFLCTHCGFSFYGYCYQPHAYVHSTMRLDLECPNCKFGLERRIVHPECGKATDKTALETSRNNEPTKYGSAINSKRDFENDKSLPTTTSTLEMTEHSEFVQNAVKKKKKPRRPCLFCGAFMADISRHIMKMHSKEPQVEAALKMPKLERIKALATFRRKGIFNANQDIMKTNTSPTNLLRDRTQSNDKLVFCSSCLAFISNKYFHKHKRTCCNRDSVSIIDSVPASLMHLPEDMQGFRNKVLSRFHDNKYTTICRSDDLIKRFGNRNYIKMQAKGDKKDEKRKSIMTDMRRFAKLFFHSKKYAAKDGKTMNNSVEIFDRQHFKYLESAINYLTIKKDKLKHGLKLALGYLIKRAALFVKGEHLIAKMDEEAAEIDKFIVVFNHHWSSIFSDAEFAIAMQRQMELRKPQQLPNEEDVIKLREHTTSRIIELGDNAYTFIAKSEFVSLRNLLVCRLTLFNARRGGEPSRLKLTEWCDAENGVWCDPSMVESVDDPLEKMLLCEFKIAYQSGKTSGKLVPLLLPEDCWKAIRRLADPQIRIDAGVHPKNPYIFPYTRASDKHVIGWECVDKCCSEASLDKSITATNMRHRAATLYAALDVPESERQLFYRHMGHSEEINRDVYQCPQAVLEVTKMGKFFRQLDKGNISDREDTSLSKMTNLSGRKEVANNRDHDDHEGISTSVAVDYEAYTDSTVRNRRKMSSDTDDTEHTSKRGKKRSNDSDYEESSSDSDDDYVSTPKKARRQCKKERLYTSWKERDSKIVEDYFKRYVFDTERSDRKGSLPGLSQLKTFLQLHPDLLSGMSLDNKLRAVKNKIFNERQKRRNRMYKSLEAMRR